METLWFTLVALMLTAYVVLDGFDIGAGIIHTLIAKNEEERKLVLRSIGPVWDGNEVWLIASGGALYFAFPVLYASAFSGFYLPLTMVLWLLMLRGIGIELRSHIDDPLWRSFNDFIFSGSSLLLAIFFGAAIGNVIRGVPLNADGYFFEALWTDFRVGPNPGILDWYTILTGIVALAALTTHGSLYVAAKTEGELNARARRIASITGRVLILLTVLSLIATISIRPQVLDNFRFHVWGYVFPMLVVFGLIGIQYFQRRGKDWAAFFCSATYLVGMLTGAAFGLYPNLLPATTNPTYGLTIHNAATGEYGLKVGLVWWSIGVALAIGYFIYLYRFFRGKVGVEVTEEY